MTTITATKKTGTITKSKDFIVKKKISIKAKPSSVWDALTNPEKTKKYFFNCEVFSDWKVGSPIVFKGKLFLIKKIEMKGKIVRLEPQKMLQYVLKNESDSSETPTFSTVTDELIYKDGETIVSINDNVGKGDDAEKRYKRSEKGWDKVLKGLKKLVEEENNNKI